MTLPKVFIYFVKTAKRLWPGNRGVMTQGNAEDGSGNPGNMGTANTAPSGDTSKAIATGTASPTQSDETNQKSLQESARLVDAAYASYMAAREIYSSAMVAANEAKAKSDVAHTDFEQKLDNLIARATGEKEE